MMHFADHLLREYGYGVITVALAIECAGILFPGETIFFGGAIYASTTHHLSIVSIILAAIAGAVLGNVVGFSIGRFVGAPMLARHGAGLGLTARRLALFRYLFRAHGGKVVFFCRFISVLRSFNALLAGASGMAWAPFLAWTLAGGIVWPCVHGLFAYVLGHAAARLSLGFQVVLGMAAIGLVLWILRFLQRNEQRLEALAMREEARTQDQEVL